MRTNRRLTRCLLTFILTLVCVPAFAEQHAPAYRVTLAPTATVNGVRPIAAQLAATYGGTLVEKVRGGASDTFTLYISAAQARVLAADPRVVSVVPVRSAHLTVNATETVNWTSGVSYSYDGAGEIT